VGSNFSWYLTTFLALVAYDGLLTRIEKLAGSLDRLGAETIDAIALSAPVSTPAMMLSSMPAFAKTPHQPSRRRDRPDESISHPSHATDADRASRGG
jgi:hypothetical protein